ncbi:hypothetical protein MASR2M79_16580 [Aminivibrio sp.]
MAPKASFSFRTYLMKVSNGMALGLFSSLIIGLILRQTGDLLSLPAVSHFGRTAQLLMGPAIGAGVAFSLGAPPLGIFSSLIAGAVGAGTFIFAPAGVTVAIGEPWAPLSPPGRGRNSPGTLPGRPEWTLSSCRRGPSSREELRGYSPARHRPDDVLDRQRNQ